MGAVASLRSQLANPTVSGMILDSPYSSLKETILEIMAEHITLPHFMLETVYSLIKPSLEQSLGFCI